jgi:hypothetical protein
MPAPPDESKPGIGGALADGVGGGKPRQLVMERREAGIGIDAEIIGELASRRGAPGDRGEHALLIRVGSAIDASTLPNRLPTPLKVSPIVFPGAVTRSLAVARGLSAVRPAALTRVPALSISSSLAVAPSPRPHAHEVGALDGEIAPSRVDLEHILEIVEADSVAHRVIGTAQEIGREDPAKRIACLRRNYRAKMQADEVRPCR